MGAGLGHTEIVPDFCTCGAQLPPDALFCHKCGKPQREEPAMVEQPAEQPPAQPAFLTPQAPPDINFHNRVAVRIGFLAAGLTWLFTSFLAMPFLNPVWVLPLLFGGGFVSVYWYRRRTGWPMSIRNGARMGWITGMFCFTIATVYATIQTVAVSTRVELAEFYRQQLGDKANDANVQQMLQVLQSPAGLATILLLSLLFTFVLFTMIPTMGGALGAKMLDRE
jgi:hypothetical protein